MTSSQVAGPAGLLAVDDDGHGGLPVVLLHSTAGSSAHWSHQLAHLRPTRRAVALDLRGHGRSEPPRDGDYSISSMAADVHAVVEGLRIPRFVLVGHSLGGGVALTYAGAHPDQIAGLLLLDPIGDGTQFPSAEVQGFLSKLESDYTGTIEGYWDQITGPDSSVRERLRADLRATPRETVIGAFRAVMQFDPHPLLGRYRGPTLSIVTPHNNEPFSLHRLGQGFPHRIVQGTGHWIQLDKPNVVNEILDEFLDTVSGKI
ncbi:MAG TPA: alpha/beta hydrolase [Gemmatimonadales bacterium]|nr:alpha/beta hydrolase [Gemmatimonadales bacterium]